MNYLGFKTRVLRCSGYNVLLLDPCIGILTDIKITSISLDGEPLICVMTNSTNLDALADVLSSQRIQTDTVYNLNVETVARVLASIYVKTGLFHELKVETEHRVCDVNVVTVTALNSALEVILSMASPNAIYTKTEFQENTQGIAKLICDEYFKVIVVAASTLDGLATLYTDTPIDIIIGNTNSAELYMSITPCEPKDIGADTRYGLVGVLEIAQDESRAIQTLTQYNLLGQLHTELIGSKAINGQSLNDLNVDAILKLLGEARLAHYDTKSLDAVDAKQLEELFFTEI